MATNGTVIYSMPIVGSTTEDRVIVELDKEAGENWIVGRVLRSDRTKFIKECSFSIPDLLQVATMALSGDPKINEQFSNQPGKGLAAGIILGAMAFGFIKTESKK